MRATKGQEMKTTILHICDYSAPYKGNFIPSLQSLEGYNGVHNVYLFPHRANKTGARLWIDELNSTSRGEVAYIQGRSLFDNIRLLHHIIKTHRVDYVFKHFYDIRIDLALKLLFPGRKVMRFMHCMYEGAAAKGLKHEIRKLLWNSNTLVGVTEAVSDGLRAVFPKATVKTVENGISFDRFTFAAERERNETPNLMCMGYNVYVKGVDIALQAVKKIREQQNVTLSIVAASHKAELTEFIVSALGEVPEWVKILPPTSDIGNYYQSADVFLAPSRTEACPYALIEAAYCKLPLVASRVGGQARLKIEGIYWFDSEDVEGMVCQIRKALSEYNSKEKVACLERVSHSVEKDYSLAAWRDNAIALVEG